MPVSARRSRKRSNVAGSWFVGRHMRGLCVKSWRESAPMATARSTAVWMPPEEETCAPISIRRLRYPGERPRPHGTEPDGPLAHRRRPHLPVQLALRAQAGRKEPPAHREHGHEPRGGRGRRPHPAVAPLARDRLGRRDDLPARPHRRLPARRRAARRRGQGVRGRGRDPVPHAERGRDRLGRRGARPRRGTERDDRGSRARSFGRTADLQLRLADGGRLGRDHARHSRRRPHLQHAEADQPHPRGRRRHPHLRARAEHLRPGRQEALEAARRSRRRGVPQRRAICPRRSSTSSRSSAGRPTERRRS